MSKPRVLVLGGLGFVGRNFVKYLVDNGLASKIRVADKSMVAMARLGKEYTEVFNNVECVQVNLQTPEGAAKAFNDPEGAYNIVVNLASETKLSQNQAVYDQGVVNISVSCSTEAEKRKVEKYICVSTAEVYQSSTKPNNESAPMKPWTGLGISKMKAEEEIKKLPGLNLLVLRPAMVYGPGDYKGIAPRLCIGAVYQKKGEKLEFPSWFEDSKISTVHVKDVSRAIWHMIANGKKGDVFNVADKTDTDQRKINSLMAEVLGIKVGSLGLITSEASKLMSAEDIQEELNSQVVPTWIKLTAEHKLEYTPLSPFIEKEDLAHKSMCVDGTAIEKTGFTYEHPTLGAAEIREQLKHAVSEGWYPPNLMK